MDDFKPLSSAQIDDLITKLEPYTNLDRDYGAIPTVNFGNITSSLNNSTGATYSIGSAITPNTVWTSSGTSTSWVSPSAIGTTIGASGKVTLKGKEADIDINGKSLCAWMEKVEQRLNILTPNPELEKEWDQLRRLGEKYRKLEKQCQEKSDMWNKLKSMPKPDIK